MEDNVRAVLELQKDDQGHTLSRDEVEKRLTGLLQELRVDHLRESPALALSGGERRRGNCPCPAAALHPAGRALCRYRPHCRDRDPAHHRLPQDRGIGVLITDHNVRETLGICDHAFIISDGHVLAEGTPEEIVENADVRRVYLGEHFRM